MFIEIAVGGEYAEWKLFVMLVDVIEFAVVVVFGLLGEGLLFVTDE